MTPIFWSTLASAAPKHYTGYVRGVAVGGYDPVAYFTKGKPTKGSKAFSTKWDGVTWRFANTQNMEKFLKNPKKYAPQFGGYCSFAVSKGFTANGSESGNVTDIQNKLNSERSDQIQIEIL